MGCWCARKNTQLYSRSNINLKCLSLTHTKNQQAEKLSQCKMQNTFMFNPSASSGVFKNIQSWCGNSVLHFQTKITKKRSSVCYCNGQIDRTYRDNALLGKQPLCLVPCQHCNLITPRVNIWIHAPEHSLRMLTIRLLPAMRHLQLR